jgi:hypothetical protein
VAKRLSGIQIMLLAPDSTKRKVTLVQKWLKKLHLFSPDEPNGVAAVEISSDVLLGWNRSPNLGLVVDGKVHEIPAGPPQGY